NGIDDANDKFTVIYKDGDNELKKVEDLAVGATLDAYTPTKTDYVFSAWTPAWKSTVDAADAKTSANKLTITYTATWKDDKNNNGIDDANDKFTVIYKDGDNELKKVEDLSVGATLTTYEPTKTDYVFDAWTPTWKSTVDAADAKTSADKLTITYTATWKDDKNNNGIDDANDKFTIIYKDGDTELKKVEDLSVGATLATYEPAKADYVFSAWTPTWKNTVDAADAKASANKLTITYTATWKDDKNNNGIDDATEAHYTVTYKDGVDGADVFADKVFDNVLTGLATPGFTAPERTGYVFKAWSPAVAATVTADAVYTATWQFSADSLTDAQKPTGKDGLIYNESEQDLIVPPTELPVGYTGIEYSIDGGTTWSDEIPVGTDAGDYNVITKYVGDENHEDFTDGPITVNIAKADQTTTAPTPAATDYTGSPQPLVNPGSTDGGTIEYSLDGTTWSTEIPKATEVGDYTVHYRYIADDNHNAADGGTVAVSIGKADQTVPDVPDAKAETPNAEPSPNTVTVRPAKPDEEYSIDGGNTWVKPNDGDDYVTFDGLTPATEYEVISRKAETDTQKPSPASEPAKVTTPKEEQDSSDAPEVDGVSPVSVTVDAKPGEEYSIDGGNTWKKPDDGEDTVTFDGLTPATEYEIISRKAETDTQNPSEPSGSTKASTTTGKLTTDVQIGEGVPETKVEGLTDELARALCTEDELHDILYGDTAVVYLKLTDITSSVPAEDKTISEETARGRARNARVPVYLDLSLYKRVGDSAEIRLDSTRGSMITVTVTVPEELRTNDPNTVRTFYVIRVHGGAGEVLATSREYVITFTTDLFSTYAIAYSDVVTKNDQSDDGNKGNTDQIAPPAPKVISKTEDSITVSTPDGLQISIDDGKTWISPEDGEKTVTIEGLEPGTEYEIIARRPGGPGVNPSPASEPTAVTTDKSKQEAPEDAPNAYAKDSTTVVVDPADADKEYSIDGGKTWVKPGPDGKVTFTGLTPETEYEVVSRKAGTDTAEPSENSPATKVTTPAAEGSVEPTPETPEKQAAGWALLNLILAAGTILAAVWIVIRRKNEEFGKFRKFVGLIPALAAAVTFFLTQDLSKPMQIVDVWTILMAVYLAVFGLITFFTRRKEDNSNNQ
ncbi:MAG: fibronectin type III domain-containing protein, partial [Lachnospiraceae bacterium]|nr:fibronectin type III domain-containing protein [Lachnospiraceae bacterium]